MCFFLIVSVVVLGVVFYKVVSANMGKKAWLNLKNNKSLTSHITIENFVHLKKPVEKFPHYALWYLSKLCTPETILKAKLQFLDYVAFDDQYDPSYVSTELFISTNKNKKIALEIIHKERKSLTEIIDYGVNEYINDNKISSTELLARFGIDITNMSGLKISDLYSENPWFFWSGFFELKA